MKNQFMTVLLTVVLLAAVSLNLSCGTTQQSNAANTNAAKTDTAPVNTAQSVETSILSDCSGDPKEKKGKIKEGIKKNIDRYSNLKKQYDENKFGFDPVVDAATGNATLYIWGSIFTPSADLDDLNKTYKGYMKKDCVTRIVFSPAPETPALAAPFVICEHPNGICPDGSCAQYCAKKEENVNTNKRTN